MHRLLHSASRHFYPRPPRGGRPCSSKPALCFFHISIHALREEGDSQRQALQLLSGYFYPRPPRGGRPPTLKITSPPTVFLSTPSARRATVLAAAHKQTELISIHALREEGDMYSARAPRTSRHFYPRPPRGGRRCVQLLNQRIEVISIHALREEGDHPAPAQNTGRCRNFYPRPPRGGRPATVWRGSKVVRISIHALREEGDRSSTFHTNWRTYFYPRPPRGGRPLS